MSAISGGSRAPVPFHVSAPSAEVLRQEFLLDPDVVFLNHGSYGATPEPVFAEYGRWQRELERQPVEFLGRRAEDLLDEARAAMADYLNCSRDDLVFVPNATTGINIVARSLPLDDEWSAPTWSTGPASGAGVVLPAARRSLRQGACAFAADLAGRGGRGDLRRGHAPDAGDLSLSCHLRHGVAPAHRGGGATGA